MANNLKRKYVGAICNRDLEVLEDIKKFLIKNYNITIVNLMKNGVESFNAKYLEKRLKKYPISFLIVKLTTQELNEKIFKIIRELCPEIPLLNTLESVHLCESRQNTFNFIQKNYEKIQTPHYFPSKLEAIHASQKGTTLIVKLNSHNIPDLPKNDRIIGIAKNYRELFELTKNYNERDVFLQEYLGEHDVLYKVYVVGNWVVSITSHNRFQQLDQLSPLELIHIRIPVEEPFKKRIIRLGRKFGMSVFGLDCIMTDKGPYVVDVNDFPSFRSVPEGLSLISDHIYNLINTRELYRNAFVKAKS
jgi:glutathione synthase/RimK-type ligase-like ATP-grasp enzyme